MVDHVVIAIKPVSSSLYPRDLDKIFSEIIRRADYNEGMQMKYNQVA